MREHGEKLYDLYYFNTPECVDDAHINYDESIRDLSVYDYAQTERKQIYDLIKYLQGINITPIPDGKTEIIYAYGKYDIICTNDGRRGLSLEMNCWLIQSTAKNVDSLPCSSRK